MADVKFSQFVNGGAIQAGDQVVGLRSGLNTRFTTNPNLDVANTVFVSPTGSDSSGTGSLNNPYATISHAMTTITTATTNNPFNIAIFGGKITETAAISLKPNIGIIGLDQQVAVSQIAPMVLDSTYLNASNSQTVITGLTMNNLIDLDFSTAAVSASHIITISGASIGSLSINANSNVLPTLTISEVGMADLTVNNCILLLSATTLDEFTAGNLTSVRQLSTIVIGNSFSGAMNLSSVTGSFNCLYFFRGNYIQNTVTLTNNRCFWHVDPSSYKTPTIVNGGTIVLDGIADGILANFTPNSYTPTAPSPTLLTSVNAHLRGIDAALSGITPDDNIVYVSTDGNDTTGNGTVSKPYATVGHAMTTITTAAFGNSFLINVSGGNITETQQIILKPFVNISSDSENITIVMNSNLIVHASWGTESIPSSYLENLTFTGGNLVFDFSSFSNTSVNTISLDGIYSPNVTANSNANSLFNLQMKDSSQTSLTLDNVICSLHSCTINAMQCGSGTVVKNSVMNFMSCLIGSGAALFQGANSGAFLNQYFLRGCKNTATVTANNDNCRLDMDASSYIVPTVTNSAQIILSSLSNSINANYSPTNYTPVATPPDLVTSVHAHLRGIDDALAGSVQDLQHTYAAGANANVTITPTRAILFRNADGSFANLFEENEYSVLGLSPAEELFVTPPVPTTSNANDRMEGYTFTPGVSMFATQFHYKATAIASGSREIGLWEFGNTTPLATGTLQYLDNLGEDGLWKYIKIEPPVLLNSGTRYVLAAVIPASETFYFGVPTGIHADIVINSGADGPNTSTLTYPTGFSGTGVNGNASLGLSPVLPTKVLDVDFTGIKNIYSYRSLIYPAIISFPGFSLAILNYSFYTRVGDIGNITAQITVTNSSTTGSIILAVPDTEATFANTMQCIGVGNVVHTASPSSANNGVILAAFSLSATPNIQINIVTPAFPNNYVIYIDLKYQIPT